MTTWFCLLRFAVCEQCILIEDNIKKAGKNIREREIWQKAKKIHREYVSKTALKILHKMIFKQNKQDTSFYCVNCHIFPLQVQLQRGMYMYRCAHCTHDRDCMHTTIDGADQTAFGLPHFNQDDKCTQEGLKYKVCLTHLCHASTVLK